MANASYCSKFPPVASASKLQTNDYKRRNGTHVYYGQDYAEVRLGRWFSSVKTSGFKSTNSHSLPVNPFQGGARFRRDHGGSAYKSWPDGTTESWVGSAQWAFPTMWNACGYGFLNHNSTPTRTRAEQSALSKCANMKINVAQAFAERRQTANLLINSVNRFVTFAVFMRRGNFSAARRALGKRQAYFGATRWPQDLVRRPTAKTFSNFWLEYSYGWRPLLSDIYGAAELIAQTATKSRPTKVSGAAADGYQKTIEATQYGVTASVNVNVKYLARCALYFDIADYVADSLKSTGISNPALLAWELLPYSFVVDWFLPVGSYLNKLNASSGLKFVKGHTSVKTSCTEYSTHKSNIHSYVLSGFDCEEDWMILDRYKLTSFPSAELPSFNLGLNLSQATSGLALLYQLFSRK
jgi:hypothetical protein